jgi:hypothetical protein
MNATPSQPHPVEWTETEGLLPPVARDLPAGRHQFHKEQLMTRIHEDLRTAAPATTATPAATAAAGASDGRPVAVPRRRNPFLRPAVLMPAAALALAGAVVTGVAVTGGDGDGGTSRVAVGPALTTTIGKADPAGAPRLLDRISLAAADVSDPAPHAGQYVYIASKTADTYPRTVDGKTEVVSEKLHSRQVWLSLDGRDGWLIEPGETDGKGETLAGEHPAGAAYDTLAKLPTDPDALLRRIYRDSDAVRDKEVPRDQAAFVAIGDLLTESYPPAGLTAALYKAAAKIPGVVAVDDAVDAVGRHGVAIAREDTGGERTEWIFDKKTLRFLGERVVVVRQSPGDPLEAGTVQSTSAITERAVVDANKQVPGGQAG